MCFRKEIRDYILTEKIRHVFVCFLVYKTMYGFDIYLHPNVMLHMHVCMRFLVCHAQRHNINLIIKNNQYKQT